MEIRTVRKPGEKGTQALMQQYGEQLVCVWLAHTESDLKKRVIAAGGMWDPSSGL